jgi:hypothetical protein
MLMFVDGAPNLVNTFKIYDRLLSGVPWLAWLVCTNCRHRSDSSPQRQAQVALILLTPCIDTYDVRRNLLTYHSAAQGTPEGRTEASWIKTAKSIVMRRSAKRDRKRAETDE